jgi:hypothetical protein
MAFLRVGGADGDGDDRPAAVAPRAGRLRASGVAEPGCHLDDREQGRRDDDGKLGGSAKELHGFLLSGGVWDGDGFEWATTPAGLREPAARRLDDEECERDDERENGGEAVKRAVHVVLLDLRRRRRLVTTASNGPLKSR